MKLKTPFLALTVTTAALAADNGQIREVSWDELVPENALAMESEVQTGEVGENFDPWMSPAPEGFPIVESLNGQRIKLPGFIVPLESDEGGLLEEFFLVPYFGACIHVPPPPPNQIVYVTLDEAFNLESMWEPYWIEGTMRTKTFTSAIGASAYSLEGFKVYKYEY